MRRHWVVADAGDHAADTRERTSILCMRPPAQVFTRVQDSIRMTMRWEREGAGREHQHSISLVWKLAGNALPCPASARGCR